MNQSIHKTTHSKILKNNINITHWLLFWVLLAHIFKEANKYTNTYVNTYEMHTRGNRLNISQPQLTKPYCQQGAIKSWGLERESR